VGEDPFYLYKIYQATVRYSLGCSRCGRNYADLTKYLKNGRRINDPANDLMDHIDLDTVKENCREKGEINKKGYSGISGSGFGDRQGTILFSIEIYW